MRKFIIGAALILSPLANADSGAGCGWGESVMNGQTGLLPHLSAGTTNGTSGNQSFGMTSGTAGCNVDEPIGQAGLFINSNKDRVARDMAQGRGETLAALAEILNIEANDRELFNAVTQQHFASIFTSSEATGNSVIANLLEVIKTDEVLAKYVS